MTAPIPATIEKALSPSWLSQAISERYPGTRVMAVTNVAIAHGVAARAAITVAYERPNVHPLPTRLFVKGGFAPDTTHLLDGGAYYREARFYRDLAPRLEVGTPLCLHASVNEASRQGVVVLENLLPTGAQLFMLGDTHEMARVTLFLDALARMHAASFAMLGGSVDDDLRWIPRTGDVVPRLIKSDPIALLTRHLEGERGAVMPARLRDPARILAALRTLIAADDDLPQFLLHGDMHLGNIFTDAAGRPGWYDWQTFQRGAWAMDVVYYVVGSLEPDERREHLPALLLRYAEALAAAGGPTIAMEEAFELYRRYLAYGLFIWSVARDSIVPIHILKRLLFRFALAADEAGTFDALRCPSAT
jgi:hypothetical protein